MPKEKVKTKSTTKASKKDSAPPESGAPVAISVSIEPQDMVDAGLHFGHPKNRQHPAMKPFIFSVRNNVSIIDLEASTEYFKKALEFIASVVSRGGTILFVGSDIPSREETERVAKELTMPYVTLRWLGGTITNLETLLSRVSHLRDLEEKKAGGAFEKYTKKEQLDFDKEIEKLNRKFGGVKTLTKRPDVLFITNLHANAIAAREAKRINIPVIAVCDSNSDPELADLIIPANDDAISSISYILGKVKEVVEQARAGRVSGGEMAKEKEAPAGETNPES